MIEFFSFSNPVSFSFNVSLRLFASFCCSLYKIKLIKRRKKLHELLLRIIVVPIPLISFGVLRWFVRNLFEDPSISIPNGLNRMSMMKFFLLLDDVHHSVISLFLIVEKMLEIVHHIHSVISPIVLEDDWILHLTVVDNRH